MEKKNAQIETKIKRSGSQAALQRHKDSKVIFILVIYIYLSNDLKKIILLNLFSNSDQISKIEEPFLVKIRAWMYQKFLKVLMSPKGMQ